MPNPVNQSAEQQTVCTNVTHLTATNGMAEIAGVDTQEWTRMEEMNRVDNAGVDNDGVSQEGGQ